MDNVIQRKQSQTTLHDFLFINEFQLSIETMAIMLQRHENNKRWRMSKTILFSKDDIIKLYVIDLLGNSKQIREFDILFSI